MNRKLTLYSDGGARGNPGPAGIGVVLLDGERVVAEISRSVGETTNNQAEYQALLAGLEQAREFGASEVDCKLDSELLVEQLNLRYKVRNHDLAAWFTKVWNVAQQFHRVTYTHIAREQNTRADRLVNRAIDATRRGLAQ